MYGVYRPVIFWEIKRVNVCFVQIVERLRWDWSTWELKVQQCMDTRVKRGHRIHLTIHFQPPRLIQTILMGVEKQPVTTAAILIVIPEDSGAIQRIPARYGTIVTFPSALVCASRLCCAIPKRIKNNAFWYSCTNNVSIP